MAGQQAGNPQGRKDESGRRPTGRVVAFNGGRPPVGSLSARSMARDFAMGLVGEAARDLGLVPGFARGTWHTLQDAWDGGKFLVEKGWEADKFLAKNGWKAAKLVSNLASPNASKRRAALNDTYRAGEDVGRTGKAIVDRANYVVHHPRAVLNDVGNTLRDKGDELLHEAGDGLRRFRVKVDPSASPPADTLLGEAARNFKIGLNRGEAAFDVASILYGGGELKAARALAKMSEADKAAVFAKNLARYRALGYPENVAQRFAEPYKGMGSHLWPRSKELPWWLGGGRLPRIISDSPLNVWRPAGMSTGDVYKGHFEVDQRYYGGKIKKKSGGGRWSGRELGWTKRGRLGSILYGSPKSLKTVAGAGIFGSTGALVNQYDDGEQQP